MNQPNPQFGSSNTTGRSTTITATGPIAQILSIFILLVLIVVGFVLGFIILFPLAVLALIPVSYPIPRTTKRRLFDLRLQHRRRRQQ
ncbi:MAG: hypothetical protein ACWA5W_09525 [Phycisphaerales bacterium]